jgi:hypothetical protein
MQRFAIRAADIHTRAPPHCFQAFQDLNLIGAINVICFLFVRHKYPQ